MTERATSFSSLTEGRMPPDRVPSSSSRAGARATERLEPHLADVATWLGQFTRTLKTCRLYEARNPNAARFREELAGNLGALLDRHGSFRLQFPPHPGPSPQPGRETTPEKTGEQPT